MYLEADGVTRMFDVYYASARLFPIGYEFGVIRTVEANIPFPSPAYSNDSQSLTLNFGLNVGNYSTLLVYDPTFQVDRLFDFDLGDNPEFNSQSTTPGGAPTTPENPTGLIVGIILGVVVLVVAGVILFFVIRRRRASAIRVSQLDKKMQNGAAANVSLDSSKLLLDQKMGDGMFGERWNGKYAGEAIVAKKLEVALDEFDSSYTTFAYARPLSCICS